MNNKITKEDFPKNIGLFEHGYFEEVPGKQILSFGYYANEDKLRLYVNYNMNTNVLTLYIMSSVKYPLGERIAYDTFKSLEECILFINEWCFLNDHLFRPAG